MQHQNKVSKMGFITVSLFIDPVVRKAYRKKALLTHPDRLPQGATDEQKAISEEQFKRVGVVFQLFFGTLIVEQVNNAYEVLIDPTKRQVSSLLCRSSQIYYFFSIGI